jgi:ABC-2 type transport system ATP-binding protein
MDETPRQIPRPREHTCSEADLVAVTGVAKQYSGRFAVREIGLTLGRGEILGLIGANGGGKTTTLRVLAGLLRPDHGGGRVLGCDLIREAGQIRKQVGYMSQSFSLYRELSVLENLRFRARIYGFERPQVVAEESIEEFGLGKFAKLAAGKLSGGWARKLQLAATLIHNPRLILLDEPTAGLDAISRHEVWKTITDRTVCGGAGIIVSTHDIAEAERCRRAALLSGGATVAMGTPEEIIGAARTRAFLIYAGAGSLAELIDSLPGVIASYPQGAHLRVVAAGEAEVRLREIARMNRVNLSDVEMRLEDAALALSARSQNDPLPRS